MRSFGTSGRLRAASRSLRVGVGRPFPVEAARAAASASAVACSAALRGVLGSFLRAAAANPGRVEVFGYLVGPAREDERLSVDGAVVFDVPAFGVSEDHDDGCECRELWGYARDAFGLDDAEYGPDEITPWYDPREPGKAGWRLWWD